MNRISSHFLKSVCLAALLAGGVQAQPKIAVVDMKKAFDAYYKTKQAEAQIKERATDSDKVYKGMIEDYKKANEDYRKLFDSSNDQAVSTDEREKRKKSAEAKLMELQEIEKSVKQFEQQARTSIGEMEKRMRDKIVEKIREVVTARAKAGAFTLVFDLAAVTPYQTPIILHSSGENDLTDAVIKEINADAPPGSLTNAAPDTKAGTR
jgi:outer membrane protein